MLDKAAVGGALGEVLRHRNGDIVKDEDLRKKKSRERGRDSEKGGIFFNLWSRRNQTRLLKASLR